MPPGSPSGRRSVAGRFRTIARWTLRVVVLCLALVGFLHLTRGTAVRHVRGVGAEADAIGVEYARAVGYRADGMLQFLQHLEQVVQASGGGVREWVASHPPTAERIEELRRHMASEGIQPTTGVGGEQRFRARTGR